MATNSAINANQLLATTSSPTFAALTLTAPLTGANGGTGVSNSGRTITLGGNISTAQALTLSGAFASTFTFTNTTSVTFPESGTLATTATTVASLTGTANQITASAATGAVTLSFPSTGITVTTGINVEPVSTGDANTTQFSYGTGTGPQLRLQGARGTKASPTITTSGDFIGITNFWGYSGSAFVNRATLAVIANETWSGSAQGTAFQFYITPNTTTTATQVGTIDSNSFRYSRANSGGYNTILVSNSSNTASSGSFFQASVGGTSATGDPFYECNVSGGANTSFGIDVSDSSKTKISLATTLGTTDVLVITTAGEVTFPLTPSFSAVASGTQDNVTGDTTAYTVLFATEIFDQNGDFASSTFTSPVGAHYTLASGVTYSGVVATNTTASLAISTSNRSYTVGSANPFASAPATGFFFQGGSVLADMDAADTATIILSVGATGKGIDILVTGANTYFNGNLEN